MWRISAFPALLACLLAQAGIVRAGDAATLEILGFSPDGRIFAFEEHGVQDGSGFPYANRFYIDTGTDSFLAGTPIRVRLDDENATSQAARVKARDQGQGVIPDAVLSENRGFMAGANAITELSANPHSMTVNPRPVFAPIDPAIEFRLEEYAVAPPAMCEDAGEMKGFRLLAVSLEPGAAVRLMHEDQKVPASRACPLGYSIAGVQTFYPSAGDPVVAVVIAVRSRGFEGPNHRFIAVTGKIGN